MPKTSRTLTVHPISLREVQVLRTVDITPAMRRVTLAGEQLRAFVSANGLSQPGFVSPGFDDEIRLLFPYPGETEPVLPTQAEGHLDWPKEPRPLNKVYTVRRWDADAGELDVDFVKHGVGVATTWAYRAEPGDRIHFFGPAASSGLPDAEWLLVAGDDTAVPAIARLLEELPSDARAQVFIEVAEDAHYQELRDLPGVEVTWLVRHGAEPGATPLLLDAVRATGWWEGPVFAWLAGEQSAVRDLRRHLVEERGVPKVDIDFQGYWKRTEVVALESDAAVPDPEKNTDAFDTFHDLTELVPPIAIRVAAGLRLGEHIQRGVNTVAALAERTSSDEHALGKLLRYLHTIELLDQPEPGHYGLTAVGEFLANEFWNDYLDPHGVEGRKSAGLFGLAESIRTGRAAYASVAAGREFAELRAEQAFADKELEVVAGFAGYNAEPIARSGVLDGVRHLVVHSNGAGAHARETTAAYPDLLVTITALPAQADWFRRDLPATIPDPTRRERVSIVEQSIFEPSPPADAVLIVMALVGLPDADAAHALRRAAEHLEADGRVLLIERTFDLDALDEHDGEEDLITLTREGGGLRTDAELDAVIAAAGLRTTSTRNIGWGTTVRNLVSQPPEPEPPAVE